MAQGTEIYSQNRLQVIEEATPGTAGTGSPIVAYDLATDYQQTRDFASHRPEGYNADLWHAVTRSSVTFSGPIKPDYAQMDKWLRNCFGVAAATSLEGGGTVKVREYRQPNSGRVDRKTHTFEYGETDNAKRATYGLVSALSIASSRAGDTDGNIEIFARKPVEGVAMSGGVPINEVQVITLDGATGDGTLVVPATTLGAGGNVTLTPGMTAGALKTALAAKTAIGAEANISVVGSSDALVGGIDNPDTAPSATTAGAGGIPPGSYDIVYTYYNGSGETAKSPSVDNQPIGGGNGVLTAAALPVGADGVRFYARLNGSGDEFRLVATDTDNVASWSSAIDGGAAVAPSANTTASGSSDGSYAITFQAALAGKNIDPITTATAGYSVSATVEGATGEILEFEPKPILPGHWVVTKASTLTALDATPTALTTAEEHSVSVSGLVNPHWVEDNTDTFTSHVDQIPTIEASFAVATGSTESLALDADMTAWPSTPKWYGFRATAPDGIHALWIDIYGSIRAVPQFDEDNNVWRRNYELSQVINTTTGYSLRVTTKTPA